MPADRGKRKSGLRKLEFLLCMHASIPIGFMVAWSLRVSESHLSVRAPPAACTAAAPALGVRSHTVRAEDGPRCRYSCVCAHGHSHGYRRV